MRAKIAADGDAAILGVGFEAPVAPRSSGWRWQLEEAGVPAVAVHTHVFARLARATARANGMPRTRQAFVPQPVVDIPPAAVARLYRGHRPDLQAALHAGGDRGADAAARRGRPEGRSPSSARRRAWSRPTAEDNLQRLFIDNDWTDLLPIVLPTEERVAAMLKGTSHTPDEVVGRMRPTAFREFWEFTVEKVAVNAVMAGAKPEYFPVILALAASGVTARSSSTTSMAMIAVVNGPIRNEIGMNSGIGALGPYNHANVTIGRAYDLLSHQLPGRLGAGRDLHGHARQRLRLQRVLSPRPRSAARGSRSTCRRASSPTDSDRQHLLRRPLHARRASVRATPGRRSSSAA